MVLHGAIATKSQSIYPLTYIENITSVQVLYIDELGWTDAAKPPLHLCSTRQGRRYLRVGAMCSFFFFFFGNSCGLGANSGRIGSYWAKLPKHTKPPDSGRNYKIKKNKKKKVQNAPFELNPKLSQLKRTILHFNL